MMTWAEAELPLLLEASGSLVAEVLDALAVKFPLAGAFTVMVKFVVAPLGKLARAGQVTVPPAYAPPPEALMKMSLLSNTSETTTLLAAVGPRLVTVTV